MASLVISEKLAERLKRIAQRENRPVEAVIEKLLDSYGDDVLLESVPPDIQDKAAYVAALREIRPKLYKKAREYWQQTGNHQRLALTDEQLDEQFWLIDHEGIPRLKTERGTIQLPPDPLEAIVGIIDTDLTDLSATVRETVAEHYRKKHGRSD